MFSIAELNQLSEPDARVALERCCGASRWVQLMVERRPFEDEAALMTAADEAWVRMERKDILEAFQHHPQIGDVASLRQKFASTATWASHEQSGVQAASEHVLEALARGNQAYREKFGYIFIVFATGKSASEMLDLLELRLPNPPEKELPIAAAEQAKITRTRLEKLIR